LTGTGVVTSNNVGLWSDSTGDVELIFRSGDPATGTPSGVNFTHSTIDPEVLNAGGQAAFRSGLSGTGVDGLNDTGIWIGVSGNLTLVARAGSQAPGTASGINFRQNLSLVPSLNDAGQVAFSGDLTDSATNGTSGIWAGSPGSLHLVARQAAQAPGLPSGVKLGSFVTVKPAFNNAGQTAFTNNLSNGKRAVYSEGSGLLNLVALSGTPAVGTVDGSNFSGFGAPVLNAAGQTAFAGSLSGAAVDASNSSAIWSEGTGTLKLIARSGNAAPGTADGVTFGDISAPSINALGQTVFTAALTGAGIDSSNDKGVWATDINGLLNLIVRTGDQLEVAPADVRTISGIGFIGDTLASSQLYKSTGNEDGLGSGFNDHGQLAFAAAFTNGTTGVFVSNLVATLSVPEPSSITLVLTILFTICAHVRDRRSCESVRRTHPSSIGWSIGLRI
jgi:hypothetical protein